MNLYTFFVCLVFHWSLNGKLLQVVSLSRHGARYYVNDVFNSDGDRKFWEQLTPVGMRQQEILGKMIRQDYIDSIRFLSRKYSPHEIKVYSTNLNRTIMSAISLMYGLYPLNYQEKTELISSDFAQPPFTKSSLVNSAKFQRTSFEYQEVFINFDEKLLPTQSNLVTDMKKDNVLKYTSQLQNQKNLFHQLFVKISKILNTSFQNTNFSQILDIYDTLTVDYYLGNPLPEQITSQDYETIIYLNYWYKYLIKSGDFSVYFNRQKINLILNNFDSIIDNKQNPLKWTFLISHDRDMTAIINDFNISSYSCITQLYFTGKHKSLNCHPGQNFSSSLIFELHYLDERYWVKIRHQGQYMYVCQKKSKVCLYSEFKQRMINYLNESND